MSLSDGAVSWSAVAVLSPLSRLTPDALIEVRRSALLGELEPGQDLFHRGSDDAFDYFLLDGTLDLVDAAGATEILSGGLRGALQPVEVERPRSLTARARTRVRYLRLQAGLLDGLEHARSESGYVVEEYRPDDETLESRLLYEIYAAYAEDRLEIPAVPELAARIRRAVDDPENGAVEVARVVQADPAVAARLLRVANSALYSGKAPVRSLREAVVRLGLQATRDLVVAFTMQNLFKPTSDVLRQRLLELWRHCSFVAAVSYTLARRVSGFEPERALMAGLLHDIGAAILITQAEAWPDLKADPARLEAVLAGLRGEIGALVLTRWGFQNDFATVARESESWLREPGPNPDLCDVVLVSQLYEMSRAGTARHLPEPASVSALRRLSLSQVPPAAVTELLDEAQKEIAEVRRLLLN